jgi:endo-1,4-beta-mannosidase
MVRDLKEVNYYPAAGGWTYMWSHFDPTAIDRDFARIRALNANTVRIFIQPSAFGFPAVHRVMADRLAEVIGLAAKHSLRVHLTLFDWWSDFTDIRGSKEWVSSLLSRYRHDPRIAVVELHNELNPQNPEAVAWAEKMLPYLSTLMPGTLLTVSTASVPPAVFALFTRELKNSPPAFWDYHYYGPASDAYAVLSRIKALAAPRPLFIGETGYSTAGTAGDQAARMQAQAAYYQSVFAAAADLGLPPPAPWTLNDFSARAIPPSRTADDPAQYGYGLFQLNGTAKPAAAIVRRAFSGNGRG